MNPRIFQAWLELQCQAIPNVKFARASLLTQEEAPISADWPADNTGAATLDDILALASSGNGPIVASSSPNDGEDGALITIAHPIGDDRGARGSVAVAVAAHGGASQAAISQLLKWGNRWLALLLAPGDQTHALEDAYVQILSRALAAASFREAAIATVGLLSHAFGLERVTIGVVNNHDISIVALSDSAEVPNNSELGVELKALMNEALGADGVFISRGGDAMAVLLRNRTMPFGVMAFEQRNGDADINQIRDAIIGAVELLAPVLVLKAERERSLWQEMSSRIRQRRDQLFDRDRRWRFAIAVALLSICVALVFGKSVYKVSGQAVIEGAIQRAIIAPFDGYVSGAYARAGETVSSGFVLAELDDKDLRIELRQLQSDKAEVEKQYRKALAALDHSQARILKAQIDRASANLDRLAQRLDRTRLIAPFAGVIVSGDLNRSLGRPVKQGEVLFEIAPLQAYRVAIDVPDQDIANVESGQQGTLVLAALTSESLPIEVVNITNMPTQRTAPGSFRVEARLNVGADSLRPGMKGVAKVAVGQRSRAWIWTHDLIDWLRFKLWVWLP